MKVAKWPDVSLETSVDGQGGIILEGDEERRKPKVGLVVVGLTHVSRRTSTFIDGLLGR